MIPKDGKLLRIESFLPSLDGAVREGLATVERVAIRLHRSRKDKARA